MASIIYKLLTLLVGIIIISKINADGDRYRKGEAITSLLGVPASSNAGGDRYRKGEPLTSATGVPASSDDWIKSMLAKSKGSKSSQSYSYHPSSSQYSSSDYGYD